MDKSEHDKDWKYNDKNYCREILSPKDFCFFDPKSFSFSAVIPATPPTPSTSHPSPSGRARTPSQSPRLPSGSRTDFPTARPDSPGPLRALRWRFRVPAIGQLFRRSAFVFAFFVLRRCIFAFRRFRNRIVCCSASRAACFSRFILHLRVRAVVTTSRRAADVSDSEV